MSFFNHLTFGEEISQAQIANAKVWDKIGYTPSATTSLSDIWSGGSTYVPLVAATQLELVSSDNTDDIGTVIKSGTSTGGSTTSLIDTGVDFTAATAVAIGDCVVLDKSGTVAEWGYVTAVATNTLTVAGGFSGGGTGSGRVYAVVDKSAHAGAQVVYLEYLKIDFTEKDEIIILNGTTAVPSVNTDFYRVNIYRIIAAGANQFPTGTLTLRIVSAGATLDIILPGYNRARTSFYTVPAGKTLYVSHMSGGYGITGNGKVEFGRLIFRAQQFESASVGFFASPGVWHPYLEILSSNFHGGSLIEVPSRILQKIDLKVSVIASATGVATSVMRGYLIIN